MATACERLFTVLPDFPDLSFPSFILCMADSTLEPAFGPYLRVLLRAFVDFALVAIVTSQ